MTPVLTKAIQEQQLLIENQQQQIDRLQATVRVLLERIESLENK